ncbi:MAG: hypothetical protein A3F72_05215 [Bacteroidetes bacterium RIFCSPLOWO2_12_FULL_35_15]|nr:MAG: hypothetical protein A3F72_05215 [Bacteroidetes bacterium RIFCSPLOWO2_12_FULL_35_15]
MKTSKKVFITSLLLIYYTSFCIAQDKSKVSIGIMNIDSKGIIYDAQSVGYITRLEVDKTAVYNVIDKYEMNDIFKKSHFKMDSCFSKSCLVNAGKLLNADKMLTGDIERFGEKIIITLRLIDVKTETIEKSDATEYLNLQPELQRMIEVSVKKLFNLPPNQALTNQLINYEVPVASPKTTLRLNGPRMGASFTTGDAGDRLQAPKSEGGFEMYPVTFQVGYQQEVRYLAAGDFQALIEFVGLIGGLESGRFIPSISFLNGFRWGKSGWEFAFGPTIRLIKKADGFYDTQGLLGGNGNTGAWHLETDWMTSGPKDSLGMYQPNPYPIVSRLDTRGSLEPSAGLIIAVGRTFRSGYLNIPVNLYVSPRKDGWIAGFSFGFNVSKKPKIE